MNQNNNNKLDPSVQYRTGNVPYHTHNGIDAPPISSIAGVDSVSGGTGITVVPTTGNVIVSSNLLSGTGISISGSTINNTGVTSIVAGTNVTISPSGGTGAVTVNATAATYTPVFKSGTSNYNSASGTQTIAHGLGTTPVSLTIYGYIVVELTSNVPVPIFSIGTYDGTTNQCMYGAGFNGVYDSPQTSSSYCIISAPNIGSSAAYWEASATWDATNIYLAWTKVGSPSTAAYFMWTATA
jgi:hypothetical protein